MKLYISHSLAFDYVKDLYLPIRADPELAAHEIVLPFEQRLEDPKDVIEFSHLLLAEISFPSIDVGVELGWAEAYGTPICLFYKNGTPMPRSLEYFRNAHHFCYTGIEEMLERMKATIQDMDR